MLVTLAEASDHLRRDTNADDADLTLKIQAASNAIMRYLRSGGSVYLQAENTAGELLFDTAGNPVPAVNSNGDRIIEPMVRAATLLLVGELYKNREGETTESAGQRYGYLPPGVTMLLSQLRDPVIGV